MATVAEELINSICKNKDVSVLMEVETELLGRAFAPVVEDARKYYTRYQSVPDISILKQKYPDLESLDTKGESAYYLSELRSAYIKNQMDSIMEQAADKMENEGLAPARVLAGIQTKLSRLNKYTNSVRDLDLTDIDAAISRIEKTKERAEAMGGSVGIPMGVDFVDQAYVTGMAPGHLIVFIGWPGKAKTWGAGMVACNAYDKGFKPMIVSLEMTPENMADRLYTTMGSGLFKASDFARGDINVDDFREFAQKRFKAQNRFALVSNDGINDVTPNIIQGKIEQHQPDLVVLDYAQLMSDNRKSDAMTPRMMNLSREVKNLAVTNQIPIILITAATAEESSDRDEPPMLSSVAWSKSIEYDADLAVAIHKRDESNIVEWIGRKNRHGELFAGMLDWEINSGVINTIYGD